MSLLGVPSKPLDPAIIDNAPLELDASRADTQASDRIIAALAYDLEMARADQKKAEKKTIEDEIALMLRGYSQNVFKFVVGYCIAVGVLLFLAGFHEFTHFVLSDAILGIIAGSTAVSVIGLIGMVVSGLFGGRPKAAASPSRPKKKGKSA